MSQVHDGIKGMGLIAARWTARVLGTMLLVFYAIFIVAEGLPPFAAQSVGVQLNFVALGLMLGGFAVGWKREGTAAMLIVSGWTLWHVSEGRIDLNVFQTPLPVAALYGYCWWELRGQRTGVLLGTMMALALALGLGRLFLPVNVFVHGTITDVTTGAAITNASLTVVQSRSLDRESSELPNARTGAGGRFRLHLGWYAAHQQVAIVAPGYASLTTNLGPRELGQRRVDRNFRLRAVDSLQTIANGGSNLGPVREALLASPQGRTAGLLDLDTGQRATSTAFGENDRETHAWVRSQKMDVMGVVEKGQTAVLCFDMAVVPVGSNLWMAATSEQVLTNWNLGQQEPKPVVGISTITEHSDTFFFRTRERGQGVLQILGQSEAPLGVRIRYRLLQQADPLVAWTPPPTQTAPRVPPVVVHTVPQSGAQDVDSSLAELGVTFSEPMRDGNWSWVKLDDETFPEMTGSPRFSDDRRTCILPVKLEPGRTYATWINVDAFCDFRDEDDIPSVPYLLIFKTKDKP